MSVAIFRAHIEQIWNSKDASGIQRFIAPAYRGFETEALISGIAGYKEHFAALTTAFPDLRITIDVALEGADRAAARYVVVATHTGPFGEIPPTGKRVRVTGEAIIRVSNRQIVEEHANSDALGLLQQLGVIPGTVAIPPLLF
jgi:predicted ester cyclase